MKISEMTRAEFLAHLFAQNVPAAPPVLMKKIRAWGRDMEVEDRVATVTLREAVNVMLDEMEARRARAEKALTVGRHEPASLYGGLYAVEEVDDNLIERVERPIEDAFVPLAELPASYKFRVPTPYGRSPATEAAAPAVAKPAVIRRRPDGTRQVLVSTK